MGSETDTNRTRQKLYVAGLYSLLFFRKTADVFVLILLGGEKSRDSVRNLDVQYLVCALCCRFTAQDLRCQT